MPPPPSQRGYKIGQVARHVGVPVRHLRYLEQIGLLRPAALSEGATRYYTEFEIEKARLVEELAAFGLPLRTIAALFSPGNGEAVPGARTRLEEMARTLREAAERQASLADRLTALSQRMGGCACCEQPLQAASCGRCERPESFGKGRAILHALLSPSAEFALDGPCEVWPCRTRSPDS